MNFKKNKKTNLPTKTSKNISVGIPLNFTQVITEIINASLDYQKIKEEEKTKRYMIENQTKIKIEEIRAKRDIFMKYIEENYKERYRVYDKFFNILELGLEKNNTQAIEAALNGIIAQIRTNPFEGFHDFKNKLSDENYTAEF
ncbi:hypothetical protein OSSY52_19090 [Tepiditoga spiralis]|uniref:Uncharacterized protein n=1 Tax=Tepiditoga spiralis TaxID=2108365 RepID=A0A7G1G5C7_9BACT|nr:hypothetical protein [Tepiditoga spiralis]BBE31768.1 hypothetical protein OSSY52_19090 [Tepiditoga spiralis]